MVVAAADSVTSPDAGRGESARPPGAWRHAQGLAVGALVVALFGYFLVPIWEMDFFWHAASGRWIGDSRSLPRVDPFGIYGVRRAPS